MGWLLSLIPNGSRPIAAWFCAQALSADASAGSDVGKVRQVRPEGRRTWQDSLPFLSTIPAGSFAFIGRIYLSPREGATPPKGGAPPGTPGTPGLRRTLPRLSFFHRAALVPPSCARCADHSFARLSLSAMSASAQMWFSLRPFQVPRLNDSQSGRSTGWIPCQVFNRAFLFSICCSLFIFFSLVNHKARRVTPGITLSF